MAVINLKELMKNFHAIYWLIVNDSGFSDLSNQLTLIYILVTTSTISTIFNESLFYISFFFVETINKNSHMIAK